MIKESILYTKARKHQCISYDAGFFLNVNVFTATCRAGYIHWWTMFNIKSHVTVLQGKLEKVQMVAELRQWVEVEQCLTLQSLTNMHVQMKHDHIKMYLSREVNNQPILNVPFFLFFLCNFRTKWKRQTAVGLELLAEAGNYTASMQRMFAPPFYYHPTQGIVSNLDGLYNLHAGTGGGQRPVFPRLFLHGLQQHVSHLPLAPRPLHPHPHWTWRETKIFYFCSELQMIFYKNWKIIVDEAEGYQRIGILPYTSRLCYMNQLQS